MDLEVVKLKRSARHAIAKQARGLESLYEPEKRERKSDPAFVETNPRLTVPTEGQKNLRSYARQGFSRTGSGAWMKIGFQEAENGDQGNVRQVRWKKKEDWSA